MTRSTVRGGSMVRFPESTGRTGSVSMGGAGGFTVVTLVRDVMFVRVPRHTVRSGATIRMPRLADVHAGNVEIAGNGDLVVTAKPKKRGDAVLGGGGGFEVQGGKAGAVPAVGVGSFRG